MAQFNQDFTMFAGNDETIRFTGIYNENTGEIISADSIIGASWGFTPYEDESIVLVNKDLVGGGVIVPEDGVVLVQLNSADTQGMSGEFTHELRIRHGGGITTASRGRMTIKYQAVNDPT